MMAEWVSISYSNEEAGVGQPAHYRPESLGEDDCKRDDPWSGIRQRVSIHPVSQNPLHRTHNVLSMSLPTSPWAQSSLKMSLTQSFLGHKQSYSKRNRISWSLGVGHLPAIHIRAWPQGLGWNLWSTSHLLKGQAMSYLLSFFSNRSYPCEHWMVIV